VDGGAGDAEFLCGFGDGENLCSLAVFHASDITKAAIDVQKNHFWFPMPGCEIFSCVGEVVW
jgi:hypothetical protein